MLLLTLPFIMQKIIPNIVKKAMIACFNTQLNSMNLKRLSFLLILLIPLYCFAQRTAFISGTVLDKQLQQPILFATITFTPGVKTLLTDSTGRFRTGMTPGVYNITVTAIGFTSYSSYNLVLNTGNETVLTIEMETAYTVADTISVKAVRKTARAASLQTPLSVQRLTTEEIKANPGGNFDVSRVIQTLPGVSGTSGTVGGFRNDIIIRGGAPNENVFYLDGIEIPNINHFATQGSGGGPTGILNVSFIEEVKLSTSAFDARFDNPLSSVMEFKQKQGNLQRTQGNIRLSATELALTLDGPLHRKSSTTYLASVRRSYLQFLFQALDLPIRPNYWDFQFKISKPLSNKTTLTLLGVGAIDEFSFAAPKESSPEKIYTLNSNPSIQQNTFTIGAALRHQIENGYWNLALSHNTLNNQNDKFENNLGPDKGRQTLDLNSIESETKLRFDVNKNNNGLKLSYGLVAQYSNYSNSTYLLIKPEQTDALGNLIFPAVENNFSSAINMGRFGAFIQAGKLLFNKKLGINAGIRTDGNTFTDDGMNLLQTFSPRIALSWVLNKQWTFNTSTGIYYKIPPYTMLGFQDNGGNFANKNSSYIRSTHYVAGFEYLPKATTRFTLEGFIKNYGNVPVSVRNGISLSNLGGDFAVFGNEAITSTGRGNSYGMEFFAQQKLTKQFFGVFSYTYFRSRYTGADNKWVSSAWENRHLLSTTLGYKFKHDWELGLRFRYQGGAPYTPFDLVASQSDYLTIGTGVQDFNRLNTERLDAFHASDIRIDKKFNFKKMTLDIFIDIQNWYAAANPAYPQYTFSRTPDNAGFATTDGNPIQQDGSNAIPLILTNDDAQITPTIGFILEF